jgi:hypothetical protein
MNIIMKEIKRGGETSYNTAYEVTFPSVTSPKLLSAMLRATSHKPKRYVQCPAKSFVVLGHPWPREIFEKR